MELEESEHPKIFLVDDIGSPVNDLANIDGEIVPELYSLLTFTQLLNANESDVWEAPKPWSPRPLTPTDETEGTIKDSFCHGSKYTGVYGSPQKNFTPPKLPPCSRKTRMHMAPPLSHPQHSTPAPPVGLAKEESPPAAKKLNSPEELKTVTVSPCITTPDTSGYSSNSSGYLAGFSPPSFSLVDSFDFDDEAIDIEPLDSTSVQDWGVYGSILGLDTRDRSNEVKTHGHEGKDYLFTFEEDNTVTPRAIGTPSNHENDSDVIYEGTSYLGLRHTPNPSEGICNNSTQKPGATVPNLGVVNSPPPATIEEDMPTHDLNTVANDHYSSPRSNEGESGGIKVSPQRAESPKKTPKKGKAKDASPLAEGAKPKEPYIALISKLLLESSEKKLILQDIYDILQEKYSYFKTAETAWRNVVRHNLSINECFIKAGRASSGRGYFWAVHPACVEMFKGGDFRRREAKKMVQQAKENNSSKIALNNATLVTKLTTATGAIPYSFQPHKPEGNLAQQGVLTSAPSRAPSNYNRPEGGYTYTIPVMGQSRKSFGFEQPRMHQYNHLPPQNQSGYIPVPNYNRYNQHQHQQPGHQFSRSAPC